VSSQEPLSVCLSVSLSLSLSVYMSVSLSVCLSVCLSVSLSLCLSLCLSVGYKCCSPSCVSLKWWKRQDIICYRLNFTTSLLHVRCHTEFSVFPTTRSKMPGICMLVLQDSFFSFHTVSYWIVVVALSHHTRRLMKPREAKHFIKISTSLPYSIYVSNFWFSYLRSVLYFVFL